MTSSLDLIRGRQVVQALTNQSGGAIIAGDVVIVSTANDESFTTTTSAAYNSTRVGVALESIAAAAAGRILLEGYAPLVNVSASATRGHYLLTHTVAKQATSQAGYAAGAFGQILKAGTSPSAMIFPVAQVGSAGIGGSSGSTDNAIIRADGTGGATVQSSLATVDDSGGVNIPTGQTYNINGSPHTHAAGASGLLAITAYKPASVTIYETTSTTLADVDATNLSVTFTAPASGNVLVRLNAYSDYNDVNTSEAFWGLRESTTDLMGSVTRVLRVAELGYLSVAMYLSGIGAGSHTYKWSFAIASGGQKNRIIIQDGSVAINKWGPGIMEVWSAP